MSDVLKNVLKSAYGVSDEKATEILAMEDAKQTAEILELDATRVAAFKKKETDAYDRGHKKAKGETLGEFEKEARAKYNISDAELKGEELISAIVTQAVEAEAKKTGKTDKVTDDMVKAHPLFVQLQNEKDKAVLEKEKEWESKYNARETELQTAEKVAKVKARALSDLKAANPILPKNAEVAATLENAYLSAYDAYDFDTAADGDIIVKTKDGKVAEDAHGHRIKFDDLQKSIRTKYYEFPTSTERGNAGNETKKDGTGGAARRFEKLEDLAAYVDDKSVAAADKEAATAAWKEDHPNG